MKLIYIALLAVGFLIGQIHTIYSQVSTGTAYGKILSTCQPIPKVTH